MLQMPTIEAVQDRVHALAENLPDASFQWPKVDLGSVDVGRSLSDAAATVHLGRRPQRSWRPLAISAVFGAVLVGWFLWSQEAIRMQVGRWASSARSSMTGMGPRGSTVESPEDAPVAFTAAETAPIAADVYLDSTVDSADYPVGLGSSN